MTQLLKIVCVHVAVALLLALTGSAAPAETWKIGHVRPAGSAVDTDIRRFAEAVGSGTDGRVRFEIFPANKLGDYSTVQERVSFGEVEMYVGPFGTALDRRLMLPFTPFLVGSWPEARRLYSSDSPLIKTLEEILAGHNIKLLGGWPVYFGGIGLTGAPSHPADPDIAKNMIIRVPPIRSFELTARALGYTPYPITWVYAKMGLKTGMVDGLLGGGAEGYSGLIPFIRHYLPVKDHFEYWFLYMNLSTWNSLDDGEQKVILNAAASMERKRWQEAEEDETASLAELQKRGVRVHDFEPGDYERMRGKIRQMVWPTLSREIGPAFEQVVEFAGNH